MLKQLQKRNQSGFTIIEVMIVLAIAGVIMMLVFLAIPALQRNNRNTQYRSDVANLLGYLSEYTSNNNGALPADSAAAVNTTTGDVTFGSSVVGKIRAGTTATIVTAPSSPTFPTTASTTNIVIMKGAKCNGAVPAAAGSRSVVALYQVETSSAPQNQCQAN